MTGVQADSFTQALDHFRAVPAHFARYDIGLDAAARVLAVQRHRVAELAAQGLPHAGAPGDGLLFDYNDVVNLAMFGSRTGESIPELALRFLLRFAATPAASWYEPRQWLVRVRTPQPPCGLQAATAARVTIQPPDATAPGVEALQSDGDVGGPPVQAPGYQIAVRLTGRADTVRSRQARSAFQVMVEALGSGEVAYQAVAEALRMEQDRAWQLGMADCVVVARLLAARLRQAGLRARARRGYLLGLIGSDHAWCELHEDGRWKPLDVVFAYLAGSGAKARHLEVVPEFTAACCGSRFNRLLPYACGEARALVHFDGQAAPAWALAGVSAHPWGP